MKKQQVLICMIVLAMTTSINAQNITTKIVFNETFDSNTNGWSLASLNNNGYEAFLSKDQRYICSLPINNSMGWNWTWIAIPNVVSLSIDNEESAQLEFDWEVIRNTSNSRFGLMFDTYNVSNNCPGGDFRVIWIDGDGQNISTSFGQTINCNSNYAWNLDGQLTRDRKINHFKLIKDKFSWTIYINDIKTLSFEFKGSLNLDHLNYGRGTYAFDNFSVSKRLLEVSPATMPIVSISTKPKIWILLAGIEKYQNQTPLEYTVDDILSMYNFWTGANGGKIPKDQIIVLTESDATSERILSSAKNLFAQASSKDVIITFLSGHGGVGTFAAYDQTMQYEYLNKIINESKAGKKICIVDACHSGSFNTKTVLTERGRALSEKESLDLFYQALGQSGNGIGYLLACKANENSIESPSLKHGLFTYFLLKGVQSDADSNSDQLITIGELYDFIEAQVPYYNKNQHPIIQGTIDRETPIAVLSN